MQQSTIGATASIDSLHPSRRPERSSMMRAWRYWIASDPPTTTRHPHGISNRA
jgi:hypothetical protein